MKSVVSYTKFPWVLWSGVMVIGLALLLLGGMLYLSDIQRPLPSLSLGTTALAVGTADATADGSSDNVEAQTLLDALPAVGGRLSILTGTYAWAAAANLTRAISNVHLDGTGYGTYIDSDGSNAPVTAGGNNWVISNMRFDAPGPNMGATTGWLWENVWVGATYYAMSVAGSAVLVSGGALGTPASGTLTNASGFPISC